MTTRLANTTAQTGSEPQNLLESIASPPREASLAASTTDVFLPTAAPLVGERATILTAAAIAPRSDTSSGPKLVSPSRLLQSLNAVQQGIAAIITSCLLTIGYALVHVLTYAARGIDMLRRANASKPISLVSSASPTTGAPTPNRNNLLRHDAPPALHRRLDAVGADINRWAEDWQQTSPSDLSALTFLGRLLVCTEKLDNLQRASVEIPFAWLPQKLGVPCSFTQCLHLSPQASFVTKLAQAKAEVAAWERRIIIDTDETLSARFVEEIHQLFLTQDQQAAAKRLEDLRASLAGYSFLFDTSKTALSDLVDLHETSA